MYGQLKAMQGNELESINQVGLYRLLCRSRTTLLFYYSTSKRVLCTLIPCHRKAQLPSGLDSNTNSIPFHSIILFQATRPIQTNKHNTTRQINSKAQKKHKHIYTTKSVFTRALLLELQRAALDFLALIIRVSKLGKAVKSNILVTL